MARLATGARVGVRPGRLAQRGWEGSDLEGQLPGPDSIEESSTAVEWRPDDYVKEWGVEHAALTGHLRMEAVA